MKRSGLAGIAIAAAILIAGWAAPAQAAVGGLPLGDGAYEHLYDPINSESPTNVPTPWAYTILPTANDPVTALNGETVTIDTTSPKGLWDRNDVAHGLDMDNAVGYTMDVRIQMVSGLEPLDILMREDDAGLIEFRWEVGPTNIEFKILEEGGGERAAGVAVPNDGAFHVYRYSRLGNNVKVYVDDQAAPLADVTILNGFDPNEDRIYWGDGSGSVAGICELDYIGLDTSGATFAAPLPEPQEVTFARVDIQDAVGLEFLSESLVGYTLQLTTDLVSSSGWMNASSVLGTGTNMFFFDPTESTGSSTSKAYRILID